MRKMVTSEKDSRIRALNSRTLKTELNKYMDLTEVDGDVHGSVSTEQVEKFLSDRELLILSLLGVEVAYREEYRDTPFIEISDLFDQYPVSEKQYPIVREFETEGVLTRKKSARYAITVSELGSVLDIIAYPSSTI